MPIYDYVCTSCSTRTEFIHAIDAPQPKFCPSCGTEDSLRKVFVPPAVHFRGSGWAKKDRSGAARARTKAADSKSGDAKDAGTSDATSDAKSGEKGAGSSPAAGSAASPAGDG